MDRSGPHYDLDPALPALALTETTGLARRLARSLAVLFVLLLIGLSLTPWQQNITGMGRVVAYAPLERQQTLAAPVEGRVLHWWVKEGSVVKAGDRVAEISDNDPALILRLEAELTTLSGRLATITGRIGAMENQWRMAQQSRVMALSAAASRVQMAEERHTAARHFDG